MAVQEDIKRIIVGVTGASGTRLALRCLTILDDIDEIEAHLVCTRGAEVTARHETDNGFAELCELADRCYGIDKIDAPIASGTFKTYGMIVIPCSMKTVAGIASGYSDNLLLRAADVTMKEGRPLVLVAREAPLSAIHLRNLHELALVPGVSICPPVLSYYHGPETIEDMENHIVCKALDRLGIDVPDFKRWK